MRPSTKTLGALGIAGAPFLFLEMNAYDNANTRLTGVYDLLYMIGWMCSIAALLRLRAAGSKKWGIAVFYIQLFFLALANISNVWVIIHPNSGSGLYRVLDLFWPISNVWMLACGITIIVNAGLQGWRRYVVLLAGIWLPITMLTGMTAGKSLVTFYISGLYSVITWAFMGWAVFTMDRREEPQLALAV